MSTLKKPIVLLSTIGHLGKISALGTKIIQFF